MNTEYTLNNNSEFYDKAIELLEMDVLNSNYCIDKDKGSPSGIIKLLEKDINQVDASGSSALILATKYNYINLVKYLICHDKCNITLRNFDDHDALYYSICHNNLQTSDLLIKTGKFDLNKTFVPNYMSANKSNTYLILAVWFNNHQVVKNLIDNGANVNIVNSKNMNAFMIACQHKYKECIKQLISHVDDINCKSKKDNLSAFEFLFNLDIIEYSDDKEIYSDNCENYCEEIRNNKLLYINIIGIASYLIEKRNDIDTRVLHYESVYLEICQIIFEEYISGVDHIILFKKFIEDGINIDACLNLNGSYHIIGLLRNFIFNFKISNIQVASQMIKFDKVYFNILCRIEYNKSFINTKILNKQIDKINYLPNGYKTLFLELSFSRKSNANIDDILDEDRFYKLKLLFDIYNIGDLDSFLEKYLIY